MDWFLASGNNIRVHSHNVMVTYARDGRASFHQGWSVCAENVKCVVVTCRKIYYLFATNVIKCVNEGLVNGNGILVAPDVVC